MKRILLVEDQNPFISEALLTAYGQVQVTTAKRGDLAIELFKASPFDGVILDLRLPILDGFVVLEALRRMDPHVPVIILSAFGDSLTRERVARLGADAYFSKPPDYPKLHGKLLNLIAQREARRFDTIQVEDGEKLAKLRRLMKLKEQAAKTGISTEPSVQIEIEDLEAEMKGWGNEC